MKPAVLGLLKKGDWGRWGENGKLYINFLTDNDITGGNSGSAVMNSRGERSVLPLMATGSRCPVIFTLRRVLQNCSC